MQKANSLFLNNNKIALLLSTGVCAIIEAIQVEQLEAPETTYNFEVEDFHTYYVTESKVLVHNKCSVFKMNKEIKSRNDLNDILRIDDVERGVKGSQIHAHFKDGTSLNIDGTIHKQSNGVPKLSKATKTRLRGKGWNI